MGGNTGGHSLGADALHDGGHDGPAGGSPVFRGGRFQFAASGFGDRAEFLFIHLLGGAGTGAEDGIHGQGGICLVGHIEDIGLLIDIGVHGEIGEGIPFLHDEEEQHHQKHGAEGQPLPDGCQPGRQGDTHTRNLGVAVQERKAPENARGDAAIAALLRLRPPV